MPERVDIYLQRNEDWAKALYLTDIEGGPIDLTGMTVAMQVRQKLNQALVAAADVEIIDSEGGEVQVILHGSEGSPLAAFGPAIQAANLHYDIRVKDTDGIATVLYVGLVVLSRGETIA